MSLLGCDWLGRNTFHRLSVLHNTEGGQDREGQKNRMKDFAGKWIEFGKGSLTWVGLFFSLCPFPLCDEPVRIWEGDVSHNAYRRGIKTRDSTSCFLSSWWAPASQHSASQSHAALEQAGSDLCVQLPGREKKQSGASKDLPLLLALLCTVQQGGMISLASE